MTLNRNIGVITCLCGAVFLGLLAQAQEQADIRGLLDTIITQEIDSRNDIVKRWTGYLAKVDMSADRASRLQSFIKITENEIAYLKHLKSHGANRSKRAFCLMVVQQRISIMNHEVMWKQSFGDKGEALPRNDGTALTDNEVETIRNKLKETGAIQKKLEAEAGPRD